MTYSVAVSGASGYAGGEILRILAAHPDVEIRTVTAHSNAGQPLIAHQPHLRCSRISCCSPRPPRCSPATTSSSSPCRTASPASSPSSSPHDTLVIDCGADHRLESEADWAAFYGGDFHGAWTYGVPELPRRAGANSANDLAGAPRIAAPGCNASTVALWPRPGHPRRRHRAARHRLGARRRSVRRRQEPQDEPARRARSSARANPYAVGGTHRHIPEIRQALAGRRGRRPRTDLVHPGPRADVARHPRHVARRRIVPGTDAARRPRRVGGRLRRRALRAAAARRASCRAPPTCSARTPPSSASRSTRPRAASS